MAVDGLGDTFADGDGDKFVSPCSSLVCISLTVEL